MLAGRRTIAPMEERAAAAFKLREAPTHAQVSSRDRGASRGLSLLTRPGKKVLHTRPACNSTSLETPHHPLQYCSVGAPYQIACCPQLNVFLECSIIDSLRVQTCACSGELKEQSGYGIVPTHCMYEVS